MESLTQLFETIIQLDIYLEDLIKTYGTFTYVLLAVIIFGETGFVIMPFLPGDSLLFVVGALAAKGFLDIIFVSLLLFVAGFLGNTVNYHIGKYIGPKIFQKENVRFLNKEHLEKTHEFYEKYGGKAIILARFMPILRTFVPFVAGIGNMNYSKFLLYNMIGSGLWIFLFVFGGFWFGNIEWVQQNFTAVILGIIVVSLMPAVITFLKTKYEQKKKAA